MEFYTSDPYFLSPIDNILPHIHMFKLHFFDNPDADPSLVIQTLKSSLSRALKIVPMLAGTVKPVSRGIQLGTLAVTAPWYSADEMLKVKDDRGPEGFDYVAFRQKNFPTHELNVLDFMTLPAPHRFENPAMVVQVNLVNGGLILGIAVHHVFADGTGSASIFRLWAACCRGDDVQITAEMANREQLMKFQGIATLEEFPEYVYSETKEEQVKNPAKVVLGLIDRFYALISTSAIFLRGIVHQYISSFTQTLVRPFRPPGTPTALPSRVTSQIISFPRSKLSKLKAIASNGSESSKWISTLDALSALLFCCITEARKSNNRAIFKAETMGELGDFLLTKPEKKADPLSGEETATMLVPVNARRHFRPPLDTDYIGNVLLFGRVEAPLHSVTSSIESVSQVAFSLRDKIINFDGDYLASTIVALRSVPDISKAHFKGSLFPELNLMISSWREQADHKHDWGNLMGKSQRSRLCPPFPDGFCFIMPELDPMSGNIEDDGVLEVHLFLFAENIQTLREDHLFNQFAEWRCS